MNVVEHDGLFKASRIAGPKHNYLGIGFGDEEQDIRLSEKRLPDDKEAERGIDASELRRVVRKVVADEAEATGQQLYVSEIEFVPTDTPDLDAYAELARAIARYAIENRDRIGC